MKRAWSAKNLWERSPTWLRLAAGWALHVLPAEWRYGSAFARARKFVDAAQWWSKDQAEEYQLQKLRELCQLADTQSAYYRRVFYIAGFQSGDLKHLDDVALLPLLNRDDVEEHLDEMRAKTDSSLNIDFVSTGGTSGKPLHFYIGADRSHHEHAYLTSGWSRAGYRLGMPLGVFRGRAVQSNRAGLRHEYDPLFTCHYYSSYHLTDEYMAQCLRHIRTLGPCMLHVYPSVMTQLTRYLQRSGDEAPTNIQGIIAESEIVYPEARTQASQAFDCRYFSGYGQTEKVVAGAECEHSIDMHIWPTYGYFELIDESGRAMRTPGERGEIVGTSFLNRAMPFIRYRTGDFATFVADQCGQCGRAHTLIRDIAGHRTQEHLVAIDGALIPWTAINMHDDTFRNIRQMQFVQHTPGQATLRIAPSDQYSQEDGQRILTKLRSKLGGRLEVRLEPCSSIATTSAGKSIYVDQRIDLNLVMVR